MQVQHGRSAGRASRTVLDDLLGGQRHVWRVRSPCDHAGQRGVDDQRLVGTERIRNVGTDGDMRESASPRPALYLAGSGSLAVEIAEWASDAGWEIAGLVELVDPSRAGTRVGGHLVVESDALPSGARAVVAAGGSRRENWSALARAGCEPATVVHPASHVAASATLGAGCVVAPGVVIGACTDVGEHTLVSRGALVGHHDRVGAFVSLLPGANIAGNVTLGEDTTVGMGAVVVDHTRVGAGATVAAGAVVLRDVPDGTRVQGVPARRYEP
jgi:sugar O-acyltransferase (sialic acid O-acetyltransferase NeuD family)